MTSQFEANFEPRIKEKRWKKEFELELIKQWEKEDWWKFKLDSNKPIFVIDTPPPYPAPEWHVGAAVAYAMLDIIARIRRMLGYNVLFPICFDGNGIPIEHYLEKYEGITPWEMDREEFEKLCRERLTQWIKGIKEIMKRFEIVGEWDYYRTDDPAYRALTQKSFKILWEKGLIYEAERPINWCPHCKTAISDMEVEYKERETKLYYIKFRSGAEEIIIATTRPELLGACRAIIFNPGDERYKHLEGKNAIVPIFEYEVPILSHPEANPEFGTGIEMVCSFGDFADVRVLRDLKIEPVKYIGADGRLTEAAGKFAGLAAPEARERIIEELKKKNLLVKEEIISHRVPVHDKCKTPIEIILMKEYYLKQLHVIDEIEKIAKEANWYPRWHLQRLIDWIKNVKENSIDWCISRRRYYGTELPIWYCKKCGYRYVAAPDRYVKPWKEKLDIPCPKCGNKEWEGEWRTLDTWMDSSITILYLTRWKRDENFFKKTFLNGEKLRHQGYDIIRTWLFSSLLRVYLLTGERAFDHIFIHGMGLDEKGRKMSKSLGNLIPPMELIEKYGAETLRMWIALECNIGENYRFIEGKIRGAGKFLVKLWNIARYISSFPQVSRPEKLEKTDEWILSELNKLIKECIEDYKRFDFHSAALRIRKFAWNIFADHYIEMTKRRAKIDGFKEEEAKSCWWTLHTVLKSLLLLLAPIIPALSDKVWRALYKNRSIHSESFPRPIEGIPDLTSYTEKIIAFNSYVWEEKSKKGIKLSEPITGVTIPRDLLEFRKDLVAMHRINNKKVL